MLPAENGDLLHQCLVCQEFLRTNDEVKQHYLTTNHSAVQVVWSTEGELMILVCQDCTEARR